MPILFMTAIACSPETGDVIVLLEPEETITGGISAGTEDEEIVDGWSVSFSKYLVAIGDVRLARTADDLEHGDATIWVVDLVAVVETGIQLTELLAVETGQWDRFSFATPTAEGALRHQSAAQADFDEMVSGGFTYLIEGTMSNAEGMEVTFRWGVSSPTEFGPCEDPDGLPGLAVTDEGTAATITIHGDHVFFAGFPSGEELLERRAQWLADSDTNGDGDVTAQELQATDAELVFPSELYNLGGAPYPINNAFDYVRGQLSTQGHFMGEGECPWTVQP